MTRLEELENLIHKKKKELDELEIKKRKLTVELCDHDPFDDSYHNGHNGDWEENIYCRKCRKSFTEAEAKKIWEKQKYQKQLKEALAKLKELR